MNIPTVQSKDTDSYRWGFDHIMTKKGIKAASADFGLIALAYNLRRLFNSKIDLQQLIVALFLTLKNYIKAFIKLNKAFTKYMAKNTEINSNFVFNPNFNYF